MATIKIKDLSENVELDRKAMQAIAGGSRFRPQPPVVQQTQRANRIVDFRSVLPARRPATK